MSRAPHSPQHPVKRSAMLAVKLVVSFALLAYLLSTTNLGALERRKS